MKFFLSRLVINMGDTSGIQHSSEALIVAADEAQARKYNDERASLWAGDKGVKDASGGWRFNEASFEDPTSDCDGYLCTVSPYMVAEISLATFQELRPHYPVFGEKPVGLEEQEPAEAVKTLARRINDQLAKKDAKVSHSKLLHAVAAAMGKTDWQVLAHQGKEVPAPADKGWLESDGNWPKTPLRDAKLLTFAARVNAIWLCQGDYRLAAKLLHVAPEDLLNTFEHAMEADTAFCGRYATWQPEHSLSMNLSAAEVGHRFRVDSVSKPESFVFKGFVDNEHCFTLWGGDVYDTVSLSYERAMPVRLLAMTPMLNALELAVAQAYEELRKRYKPAEDSQA